MLWSCIATFPFSRSLKQEFLGLPPWTSLDAEVQTDHSPIISFRTFYETIHFFAADGLVALAPSESRRRPGAGTNAQDKSRRSNPPPPARDRTRCNWKFEHAIDKGLLLSEGQEQNAAGGYWSAPETPGLTALVLTAFVKEPTGVIKANPPDYVKKGYDFLLQCQQPDGGIYLKGLANYSTSVCAQALLAADPIAYERELKRARMFLIGLQGHYPPGSEGEVNDGGIGYDAQDMPVTDPNSNLRSPPVPPSCDRPEARWPGCALALRSFQHLRSP